MVAVSAVAHANEEAVVGVPTTVSIGEPVITVMPSAIVSVTVKTLKSVLGAVK